MGIRDGGFCQANQVDPFVPNRLQLASQLRASLGTEPSPWNLGFYASYSVLDSFTFGFLVLSLAKRCFVRLDSFWWRAGCGRADKASRMERVVVAGWAVLYYAITT